MIYDNFSLEKNGLASNGYFTASSYFQYIPCFLGMLLSVGNLNDLTYPDNEEKQELLDDLKLYLSQNNITIMNTCDYMYYYYGLKYMDPLKMLHLKDNPLKLSEYYLIQDYENGGMKQAEYSFINQMTIKGDVGDIYQIAIVDLINGEPTIINKEYVIGESGIIQFYNTKILGVIPKGLLEPPTPGYELPVLIFDNRGYDLHTIIRDIQECPFEDEILKYNNTLNRVDMVITTTDMKEEELIEQDWPQIEIDVDDDEEIILGPLWPEKRTFANKPYFFNKNEEEE